MIHTSLFELVIVYRSIGSLSPNPNNARTHSKHQVRQIADSIESRGFTNPILLDRSNTIIAGHGRVEAAKLLGMNEVPTIRLDTLTSDQVRAYVIADNRLAENAEWDKSILAIELQHLLTIDDFDIRLTGFEVPEIDLVLHGKSVEADETDVVEIAQGPPVTCPGDLWQLGKHRVFCGSALQESAFVALLANRRADVVFTDPPYNVEIDGNVCGKGSLHHREFAMAAGEMSEEQFIAFLTTTFRLLHRFSRPGSVHFICMDWRHIRELIDAGRQVYDEMLNLCIWAKNNGGMGSFYRSQHELVFVFRNGQTRHRNNIQLGRFGRNRTNVWEYPGANTLSKNGGEGNLLALHPTVKPVALVADALLDCSARGDLVLDSFLGSGTTLMAAERVGRICHGIEIDPLYVDTSVRRWQTYTGDVAVNQHNGKTFRELAALKEVSHEQ